MLVLVRGENNREKAIDVSKTGWEATPVENNNGIVNIVFDSGFTATMPVSKYEELKKNIAESGALLDTTSMLNVDGAINRTIRR